MSAAIHHLRPAKADMAAVSASLQDLIAEANRVDLFSTGLRALTWTCDHDGSWRQEPRILTKINGRYADRPIERTEP